MVRRNLKVRYVQAFVFTLALLGSGRADAQFNARGRSRSGTSTKAPQAPSSPSQRITKPAGDSASEPSAEREQELIKRYRKLIIEKPGEEVPVLRLAELIRKRDGNIESLLTDLKSLAMEGSTEEKYGSLLALSFYLMLDASTNEALTTIKQAIQLFPKRGIGHQLQGKVEALSGDKQAAILSFERALQVSEPTEFPFLLRELRQLSLELGDLESARNYHVKLTNNSKGNSYLEGELGRELLSRGLTQPALDELKRVAEKQRHDPRAHGPALLDLGEAELKAGKFDQAILHLERAAQLLQANPGKQLSAQRKLAEAHQQQGTLKRYLTELEKQANNSQAYELLGRLYEQEGQSIEAVSSYRQAARLAPGDIDLKLRLARVYELTGDVESAVLAQKSALLLAPNDIQLSLRLMNLLLAQGQRQEALQEWDRIYARAHTDAEASLLLADYAERLQENERQLRVMRRLSEQGASDYRILIDLGSRYFRRGDEVTAKKIWQKIPGVVSDQAKGQVILAEVLIDHEAFAEGLTLLKAARDSSPQSANVVKALALGLERALADAQRRQQLQWQNEAIEQFETLLHMKIEAKDAVLARRHLVRLYKQRGDLLLQIEKIKQALTAQPQRHDLLRLLAVALDKAGDQLAAASALTTYCQKYPGDVDALNELAQSQLRAGDYDGAAATWKRLVQADPKRSREYYKYMSDAAKARGNLADALNYAKAAAERQADDPIALSQLGDLYVAQGLFDEAQDAFGRALLVDDSLDAVRLQLADLLSKSGQADAAFEHLSFILRTSKDDVALKRASSRLLNLGITSGRLEEVEATLRRLAIARPETKTYRQLFFEILSSQVYPLELKLHHGSALEADAAKRALGQLAARSSVILLAALSAEEKEDHNLALKLLSYDASAHAHMALLAFAEGNHPIAQRTAALLAIEQPQDPVIVRRLVAFLRAGDEPADSALAAAAVFVLRDTPPAYPALLKCTEQGSAELQGQALLALSLGSATQASPAAPLEERLLTIASDPSLPRDLKVAALLGLGAVLTVRENNVTTPLGAAARNVAILSAQARDVLVAQSALVVLAALPVADETERALTSALLSSSDAKRRAAQAALYGNNQASSTSFFGVARSIRPEATQLSLAHYERVIVSTWLNQQPILTSAELPSELRPHLLLLAQEILSTSAPDTTAVLTQFNPGGLLVEYRERLKSTLLKLAQGGTPVSTGAVRHLRPSDSPEAQEFLLDSLASSLTRDDALSALAEDASESSRSILESYERLHPHMNWSERQMLIEAWTKLEQSDEVASRNAAKKALLRLDLSHKLHKPATQTTIRP